MKAIKGGLTQRLCVLATSLIHSCLHRHRCPVNLVSATFFVNLHAVLNPLILLGTFGLSWEISDSAVKQILLSTNEKQSFIIEDLDDFHLVIKADEEFRVRRELEAEVSSHLSIVCVELFGDVDIFGLI